ncbi:MAG TPA: hypothetical protein VGH44_02190 [Candidatus Saccharimonadia bacterium]
MRGWRRQLVIGACLVLATAGGAFSASDPTMTSSNYSATETEVGGNGCSQVSGVYTCGASSNYSLNPATDDGGSSLGEATVGNSASSNYQSNAGFDTTAQPGLMLSINTASINFGVLSTAVATTKTASFSVSDYTSSGYVVQAIGSTPSYSGHNLTAITTATCGNAWGCGSAVGTEQFGINLVADRSPVDPVPGSADPACQATGFCYGVAGDGITGTYGSTRPYTVGGLSAAYRYVSGETVASGPKSSGETDYTVTFLANISTLTPSGGYSGSMTLVATGTY